LPIEGVYLVEKGLEVHPFLGESLVLREVCIKNLEGSIAKELINLHSVN
jgi:hypothetical protein